MPAQDNWPAVASPRENGSPGEAPQGPDRLSHRPDRPATSAAPSAQDALIDDFYRKYVHMVLYARKGSGTWLHCELTAFTVYLHEPAVICINEEPHGWNVARTLRGLLPGAT